MPDKLVILGEKRRETVDKIMEPPETISTTSKDTIPADQNASVKKTRNYAWLLAIPIVAFVMIAIWWQNIHLAKVEKSSEGLPGLAKEIGLVRDELQKQSGILTAYLDESQLSHRTWTIQLDSLNQKLNQIQISAINLQTRHPLTDSSATKSK
jgi:hypothetical protein